MQGLSREGLNVDKLKSGKLDLLQMKNISVDLLSFKCMESNVFFPKSKNTKTARECYSEQKLWSSGRALGS